MPKLSIVIPVYKTPERYFAECMQSVLNQTLSDIEVILVDDGSPDHCPALCDAYAEQDSRVRVLHQENKGVSVARNNGMAAATGKWLMFVDADDWIEPDAGEKAVGAAEKLGVQVLRFAIHLEWERERQEVRAPFQNEVVLSGTGKKELVLAMLNPEITTPLLSPCCAVLDLDALRSSGVCFPAGIPIGEDQIFNLKTFALLQSVAYADDCLNHYRQRSSSVMGGFRAAYDIEQERYMELMEDIVQSHFSMDDVLKQMLNLWRCAGMQRIVYLYCFHPDAHMSYRQRVKACNALTAKPENRAALQGVDVRKVSLKYKIYIFCLRNRMYGLLVFIKRVWSFLHPKTMFE